MINLNRELDKLLFGIEDTDIKMLPIHETGNDYYTTFAYLTAEHYSNGVRCRDYTKNSGDNILLIQKMIELEYDIEIFNAKNEGFSVYFRHDRFPSVRVGTTGDNLLEVIAQSAYNALTFKKEDF